MVLFTFECFGHSHVTSRHKSTLEFTVDSDLTFRGDCILGVRATTNLLNLPDEVKSLLRDENNNVKVILNVLGFDEEIKGKGHPNLQLSDESAIIIRKSNFLCPKTLMINADKSASDISKEIRELMKNPSSKMKVTIQIENGEIEASKQA